jgi:DNA-directed RNA polymerase subunit RPC12/RpoP
MRRATLEIRVINNTVIIYKCSNCDKHTLIDKMLLRFDECPRCHLKFKNKAKIIRGGNELYDFDRKI